MVVSGTAGLGHRRYMPRMITIKATLLVRNRKKKNLILYFFFKKRVLCSIGILREIVSLGSEEIVKQEILEEEIPDQINHITQSTR